MTALLAEMTDERQIDSCTPAFRGRRSPGKGKARRGSPHGPDGIAPRKLGRQHSAADLLQAL